MKMAKKPNIFSGANFAAAIGNTNVMIAAKDQWVKEPKLWPWALTDVGNISAMITHITVPWPIAWEIMKTMTHIVASMPAP